MWRTLLSGPLRRRVLSSNRPQLLRCYAWLPTKQRNKLKQKTFIIENSPNNKEANFVSGLRHYLKSTEIPKKLRSNVLRTKLLELVNEVPNLKENPEVFSVINATIVQFLRENEKGTSVLTTEELYLIFNRSFESLIDSKDPGVPPFMAKLAQLFTLSSDAVPVNVLVKVVLLGTMMKFATLSSSLEYVAKNRKSSLPLDFTKKLLDHYQSRKELDLSKFEALLLVGNNIRDAFLVDSSFCNALIDHVELLFAENSPKTHEYLDMERNVHRIQMIVSETIKQTLFKVDTETNLKMLSFKSDLNSVAANEEDIESIGKILTHISSACSDNKFQTLKEVLFRQNLSDESLAETLLLELAKEEQFSPMTKIICGIITADDIKYSSGLRLRASLIECFLDSRYQPNDFLFEKVRNIYLPYLNDSEIDLYYNIVQAAMASGFVQPSEFLVHLNATFAQQKVFEPSLNAFKSMIDRAVASGDADYAWKIFQQSLGYGTVQWDQSLDPAVGLTLNNLIILIARDGSNMEAIFPKFRSIRQHMTFPCNAEALNAMATKMLQEEFVGDVIEMLKRELPKIDKDASQRINVVAPHASTYRQLFDTLHNFVLHYKSEETYETNWVLYGELHKYFHVPYESYMPALEFFCNVDRLNAALIIIRLIKMLSERHGSTYTNPPPLREMYIYLLQVFGDRLYEEGVIEVHEFLKMDVNINSQDINLQNCILNAYSNLQNVGKVRDLFLSISSNAKQSGGINEETAQIMIKTYTYSDMLYVNKFWNNLSQFGVFPNYAVYKQYVIAHVYHGFVDEAFAIISSIDDYNIEFSSDLLLSMHNYCLDPKKQELVAKWAIENHKEDWERLKMSGLLKTASNYMPDSNLLTSGET